MNKRITVHAHALILALCLTHANMAAQTRFDVASIRPRKETPALDPIRLNLLLAVAKSSRNGIFNLHGAPVGLLIQLAWNVADFQVAGLPEWAKVEGYDIDARAETAASFEQMRPMLQALLTERFGLAQHRETRQLSVCELTVANGGVKMARTKPGACVALEAAEPPRPGERPAPLHVCGGLRRGIMSAPPDPIDRIEAVGVPVSKLTEILTTELARTVIDKTGLDGQFDFRLDFIPPAWNPGVPAPSVNEPARGVSIFTALREQAGLRLQAAKGPVEVLVVDRVQRPTPN